MCKLVRPTKCCCVRQLQLHGPCPRSDLASIKLSAQEKEETNKIQDLVDILHTTDYDWIEDLEMIPAPLKPQKTTQQQKPDDAAQLMTTTYDSREITISCIV